jgi:hypothetical protein
MLWLCWSSKLPKTGAVTGLGLAKQKAAIGRRQRPGEIHCQDCDTISLQRKTCSFGAFGSSRTAAERTRIRASEAGCGVARTFVRVKARLGSASHRRNAPTYPALSVAQTAGDTSSFRKPAPAGNGPSMGSGTLSGTALRRWISRFSKTGRPDGFPVGPGISNCLVQRFAGAKRSCRRPWYGITTASRSSASCIEAVGVGRQHKGGGIRCHNRGMMSVEPATDGLGPRGSSGMAACRADRGAP